MILDVNKFWDVIFDVSNCDVLILFEVKLVDIRFVDVILVVFIYSVLIFVYIILEDERLVNSKCVSPWMVPVEILLMTRFCAVAEESCILVVVIFSVKIDVDIILLEVIFEMSALVDESS